jgi:hypothetical protein
LSWVVYLLKSCYVTENCKTRSYFSFLCAYWLAKNLKGWALVAHPCNPSYSGGSQFKVSPGK